jgi:hypothetical protein
MPKTHGRTDVLSPSVGFARPIESKHPLRRKIMATDTIAAGGAI